MSGPLLGLPAAVANLEEYLGRVHQWCPDFSNATLNGCKINTNGDVEIGFINPTTISQDSGIVQQDVYSTFYLGQKLLSAFAKKNHIAEVQIYVYQKYGTPPPLRCSIYNATTSQVLETVSKEASQIRGKLNSFKFSTNEYNTNDEIHIRFECDGGSSNHYKLYEDTANPLANSNRIYTSNQWGTINDVSGSDLRMRITFSEVTTSGTVTEDVALDSIYEWKKYYRKATTGTNSSVSCAIKDTSDNVLIANVADKDNINSIDATTYKTIRLVHTLSRNATSDPSPKLHYREVTYVGEDYLARDTNTQVTP